jgi:hypothetical protein
MDRPFFMDRVAAFGSRVGPDPFGRAAAQITGDIMSIPKADGQHDDGGGGIAAIVIVNHNGAADLIECLEALLRSPDENWRIIVVDNKSTDNSLESLRLWSGDRPSDHHGSARIWGQIPSSRRADPTLVFMAEGDLFWPPHRNGQIIVIQAESNRGFAAANNVALGYAFNDPRCQYGWLLNPDTVALPGAGQALLDEIRRDPGLGMVGSTLVYYHCPTRLQGLGVAYDLLFARGRQLYNGSDPAQLPDREDVQARITYVIGASMILSRAFYESIGPMNEEYFLYFEEMDWSERSSCRFNMSWAPRSIVYHKEGGSIGTSTTQWTSATSVYYMTRGIIIFYWNYHSALMAIVLFRLVYNFVRMALAGKTELCAALLRGAVSGLTRSGKRRAK